MDVFSIDILSIIAFVLGAVIVGVISYIKYAKLIKADKFASKIISALNRAVENYSEDIKAYDAENGTSYYEQITRLLNTINEMQADSNVTPMEFAVRIVEMYEEIDAILEALNLKGKINLSKI